MLDHLPHCAQVVVALNGIDDGRTIFWVIACSKHRDQGIRIQVYGIV